MIRISLGNIGCISGDTIININRCSKGCQRTIKHIYTMFHNSYKHKNKLWNLEKPTYVRSFDGEKIRLHKIKDVVYSGKKSVCKLYLIDGKILKATPEHKIMTSVGWVKLVNLKKYDKVMIDTLKPSINKKISFKLPDTYITVPRHPYNNYLNRIEVHRLVYESKINNLSFMDYLDVIWNGDLKNIKFINPKKYHIHHIDKNHYNNSIDNLICLEATKHKIYHGEAENFRNFNQGITKYVSVDRIEYLDKEIDTYDIICEDPFHNFVANGIVIHNSGKTLSEVRNLYHNPTKRITHSNITTMKLKNNVPLKPEMIIRKVHVRDKKHKDGSVEPLFKYEFNQEYWKKVKKPLNIVFDEAHTLLNPRRAMSKTNVIMTDFLALLRRILGSNEAGEGEAVFITQLPRRLDPITREMATEIRHHIGHYQKICNKCKFGWNENSDMPERLWDCPRCSGKDIKKCNHIVEVLKFSNMGDYQYYLDTGRKTYFNRYMITDGEKYFKYYDTLQWDSLFSEFY